MRLPHWLARKVPLGGERLLRAYHAEFVALRVGQDHPGLSAGLPDVDPARPEREKALNLVVAILSAAGEVDVNAVLDGLRIGHRHKAHADGRVLIEPDDDLAVTLRENRPAERLSPESGQSRQIMSVNDYVMESHRHDSVCARTILSCMIKSITCWRISGGGR